ncbi:glutamine--tRNA ligase-like [Pyrus ussuriensis x Pyrus communis]|uniref:Glutamine--tRNA ligase-like n=1 Tax=Pyrus ussuriensis x Pyrus communis TaxID=2448454 RepID=A0A5N5FAB5_9ROSA|nr:glutamine--tRNA ligase-like [Pyrus ussuriensis x Pyrus communis]
MPIQGGYGASTYIVNSKRGGAGTNFKENGPPARTFSTIDYRPPKPRSQHLQSSGVRRSSDSFPVFSHAREVRLSSEKEKNLKLFLKVGLDERTAKNIITNTTNLTVVIHEAVVTDGSSFLICLQLLFN